MAALLHASSTRQHVCVCVCVCVWEIVITSGCCSIYSCQSVLYLHTEVYWQCNMPMVKYH